MHHTSKNVRVASVGLIICLAGHAPSYAKQGIEQSTAYGATEATACANAMNSATANAKAVMGSHGGNITSKKCECREDKEKKTGGRSDWSCIAFVSWNDGK